jgi:hypothetical protein
MLAEELLMVLPNPFRAASALYRTARAWFRGDALIVSGRVREKRRKICNSCPRRDPHLDQCLECSCFLALKLDLATEDCPLSKWPK